MNLVEILKAKGVSDELITAIQDDMKANSIYTASEENLDIRYGKLKTQHDEATKKLNEALKASGGSAELQQKLTATETENAQLKAQLNEALINGELQVKLLSAGAKPEDIDYIMFKMKAKGALELGEDGKVKDIDDKIAAAKTQLPANFTGESKKKVFEFELPANPETGTNITKEDFAKMGYQDRLKVYQEQPETYAELTKN